MKKHTQGPWRIIDRYAGVQIETAEHGGFSIIPHISMSDEEVAANARLIAAAPDLLEALNELYAQVKDWPGFGPSTHLVKAAAAIRKATEETP